MRIGGDRVIIGRTNWAALTHQQLYDAICGNNDPGVVFDVSDRWITLGNAMLESANTLHQQVMNSTAGWGGDAAESSRDAVIQLVDWGGKASQTAQFMGHQLNQQGQVLATAKVNMPPPPGFDLVRTMAVAPGLAGFSNSLVDTRVAAQAAEQAHTTAVDVAVAMETASVPIDAATPEFEPVPSVRRRATATPATLLPPIAAPPQPSTSDGWSPGQVPVVSTTTAGYQPATTAGPPAGAGSPSGAGGGTGSPSGAAAGASAGTGTGSPAPAGGPTWPGGSATPNWPVNGSATPASPGGRPVVPALRPGAPAPASGAALGGPGSAMGGARRGRPEEDKEHKTAGYVRGDDVFESIGGELLPSVLGERRPRPQS